MPQSGGAGFQDRFYRSLMAAKEAICPASFADEPENSTHKVNTLCLFLLQ